MMGHYSAFLVLWFLLKIRSVRIQDKINWDCFGFSLLSGTQLTFLCKLISSVLLLSLILLSQARRPRPYAEATHLFTEMGSLKLQINISRTLWLAHALRAAAGAACLFAGLWEGVQGEGGGFRCGLVCTAKSCGNREDIYKLGCLLELCSFFSVAAAARWEI